MARVLVVDDDLSVASTIDRLLRSRGHETVVVHNGRDAIKAAKEAKPDLVILDVMMPEMNGIEACKIMRSDLETAHLPIIFLTAKAMIDDKIEGFEAGADDYLTKPFDIQELALRVRALLRRVQLGAYQLEHDDPVLAVGNLQLNRQTFEVTTPDHTVLLTPIEFEVLFHLMKHEGEVFSSDRLLEEIWAYPPGTGDPALVRMHIRNLRAKIEPENAPDPVYIRTVSRHGYTVRPG
ncbi:MAG: response regulator transcription factor [Anaerolineae bacterium]|nr:response regulator transcription factor [Anaerolineae bacterium]